MLLRSVKIAVVAGTILALINYRPDLVARRLSLQWVLPMLATYLILFASAVYVQCRATNRFTRPAP